MTIITATPSKAFFVGMLVKDIDLEDAILDLMDNSLDGMLRSIGSVSDQNDTPYSGYKIEINFNETSFSISDNCGGIPTEIAREYAFRMGRPSDRDDDFETLGMFGIGMKRAMFKMGTTIHVVSKNAEEAFQVDIDDTWLSDDNNWELNMTPLSYAEVEHLGTEINVTNLMAGIQKRFTSNSGFEGELYAKISTHYANLIKKGLNVYLNGIEVKPINLGFLVSSELEPYYYQEITDNLSIKITVGISKHALDESKTEVSDSSEDNWIDKKSHAGWTIICNDRVVLYADRTRLTGWEDTLPRFHYQYNDLIGIVEFRSKEAHLLPVTTTKRGVDASSDVYLRIKKRMKDGMKKYISYTNKWKNKKEEEREKILSKTKIVSLAKLQGTVIKKALSKTKDSSDGEFYTPILPEPPSAKSTVRNMRFSEEITNIESVAEYLFEDKDYNANDVAKECFKIILGEAKDTK